MLVDLMDQSKDQNPNWWQPGVNFFFEITGWLVGPLLLALFLGRWLDQHFQTRPWLFLISVGLAFILTIAGIFKEARMLMRQVEKSEKGEKPTEPKK